jgi:two-component system LytT family sensor kinase
LIQKSKYILYAIHTIVWGLLLFLPYLVSDRTSAYTIGAIPGLFFTESNVIHMVVFYANAYYFYPKFYNKNYWWLYIPVSIAVVLISIYLKQYIAATWFPEIKDHDSLDKFIIVPTIIAMVISAAYRGIIDSFRAEQDKKEKQAVLVLTELKFLRSQISPHFLFNVLTNLVSLARKKSDKLEQSLIMLSDLMRYMLYDTQGKKIELQKELAYINSYIELQKLRFEHDIYIESKLDQEDGKNHYFIEPMLLIPFVENAFKHGAGSQTDPFIKIDLSVTDGTLTLDVRNNYKINEADGKAESSGIGLDNVRSRLNLLYADNHQLAINDDGKLFHVNLKLQLI